MNLTAQVRDREWLMHVMRHWTAAGGAVHIEADLLPGRTPSNIRELRLFWPSVPRPVFELRLSSRGWMQIRRKSNQAAELYWGDDDRVSERLVSASPVLIDGAELFRRHPKSFGKSARCQRDFLAFWTLVLRTLVPICERREVS